MSNGSRFWSPPTGRVALDADGFLADPGSPFGFEQTLETYEQIDHHRCLILLGEPGIGKTTELGRAVAAAGERAHHVDLGAVADAAELRRRVVDAEAVVAWRDGDGELVMFLDAFGVLPAPVATAMRQCGRSQRAPASSRKNTPSTCGSFR